VLIIRRSKLYYTASGIITLCGWPSGAQVERGLCTGPLPSCAPDGHLHVSSTMCSSSGQNCIIQHLVSSHFVGGRPVHRLREDCAQVLFQAVHRTVTYMFRALCAHHQVKIVLYSIWYHHTCRWPSGAQSPLNLCTGRPPIGVTIPVAV